MEEATEAEGVETCSRCEVEREEDDGPWMFVSHDASLEVDDLGGLYPLWAENVCPRCVLPQEQEAIDAIRAAAAFECPVCGGRGSPNFRGGQTPKGGYTRETLASWGIEWPPGKNWKNRAKCPECRGTGQRLAEEV